MKGVFIEGMDVPRSCSECYIREKNSCPLLKTYVSDWGKPLECPIRGRDGKMEKTMYESPITRITADIMGNIEKREEDYLVESVRKVGFDIDKEELVKALRFDRDQYEKGFADGRLSAEPRWIPVTERLPEPNEMEENGVRRYYLTQTEYRDMMVCSWNGFKWEQIYQLEPIDDEVVAWMPLPKPWKGVGEDNEQ